MGRVKLNRWLIALVTLAMFALVFAPEEKNLSVKIDSEHPEADYTMENVTITQYSESGKRNHKLIANKMIHYNESSDLIGDQTIHHNQLDKTLLGTELSILEQPNIFYVTPQGEWQLSANIGRMTNQQSLLFLEDKVRLSEKLTSGIDSTQITTADLQINLSTKIAQTDKNVEMVAENLFAKSKGMKIDIENSQLHLISNVHSQIIRINN